MGREQAEDKSGRKDSFWTAKLGEAGDLRKRWPIDWTRGAKDVGDLQARPRHRQAGGGRLARLTPSRSSGLLTSRMVLTATRV
jgi:hypothetical protein